MRRQLHPLRLASRESRSRLPQPQISQPDFIQHPQLLSELRYLGKKSQSFFHREAQYLMNILAAIANFQHSRLVARTLALFANQFYVGEKLHFHRDRAVALTSLAPASRHVE